MNRPHRCTTPVRFSCLGLPWWRCSPALAPPVFVMTHLGPYDGTGGDTVGPLRIIRVALLIPEYPVGEGHHASRLGHFISPPDARWGPAMRRDDSSSHRNTRLGTNLVAELLDLGEELRGQGTLVGGSVMRRSRSHQG
ncbi:hypothetical protein L1887_55517 [Cichorium endivia]|nr:hypothetical protein L1887_55517 [Cichorium endivia]